MADINNARAVRLEASYQSKKTFDVMPLEAAGRFVHKEDPRIRGNGPTDLNYLLSGDRKFADRSFRANIRMVKIFKHGERPFVQRLFIEPAEAEILDSHQDIFRYGEMRCEHQFLMD